MFRMVESGQSSGKSRFVSGGREGSAVLSE